MLAGCSHDSRDVLPHIVADVDRSGGIDHFLHLPGIGNGFDRSGLGARAGNDFSLFILFWIAKRQPQHKPVDLRFGKRKSTLQLDWILGGDDQKWTGQLQGIAFDRNSPLFHRFEQCRLGAGSGPVDLVGNDHIAEDRSRPKSKITLTLIEKGQSGDVAGQEIGCELNPVELPAQADCQCPGHGGFTDPRYIFQQDMALG